MTTDQQTMLMEAIRSHYQAEWVLLEDPQTNELQEVQGGKVLWHSKDRDEVCRKGRELQPKHSAIVYTGTLPPDSVIVL